MVQSVSGSERYNLGVTFVADRPERLDKFLARMMPEHSRSKLAKLIDAGEVRADGETRNKPSFPLEPGMVVALEPPDPTEPHDLTPVDLPLAVVYEDEYLLVVNKPRGLAVHPASTLHEPSLVNVLLAHTSSLSQTAGAFRPGIVHRLDKDTTGLMVVAKTDTAHVALAKQIEGKSAERRYFAVVAGALEESRFVIDLALARSKQNRLLMAPDPEGKRAVTNGTLVSRLDAGTLLALRLETGRTHQIRVHLRAVGHPVLGDRLYAPKPYNEGPLQLHAASLAFDHPVSGERLRLFASPPEDFLGREQCTEAAILGA